MSRMFSSNREGRVKRIRRFAWCAALGAIALLSPAACRREGDPVRSAVDDLARAASRRDAAAVLDLLAPDFTGADGTRRADVESMLRRYFAAYEKLDVTLSDVSIERSEGAALARFRAEIFGRARKIGGLDGLLPATSSWRFEARLAPEKDGWKVTWASWSEAR